MPISELDLSVRASNCLESARIETVAQLVTQTEPELLKLRSFNRLDREDAAGPPSHSERLLSPSALQKERVAMGLSERAIRCGARSLNLVA